MSLHDLQILFGDLTLGTIAIDKVATLTSSESATELGYDLTAREIELLQKIDWKIAAQGLEAHRNINDTLKKAHYVPERGMPGRPITLRTFYPYATPEIDGEVRDNC